MIRARLLTLICLLVCMVFVLAGCAYHGSSSQKSISVQAVEVSDQYEVKRLAPETPFPGVNGAAIGTGGDLYLAHTGNGMITRIDLDTMEPRPFVPPYGGTFIVDDVASDDRGNLYATGTTPLVGEVYRINENGVKTVIASGMAAPNGIEYNDRTGRLFVSECFQGNRIYEVDPRGEEPAEVLVPEDVVAVPEGFDFHPETNHLIVPDLGTGKILSIDPDTGSISTVAKDFDSPIALTIGPEGMVYIPELTGAVYRMSPDGSERQKIAQLRPGLDNVAVTEQGRVFVTSYWEATVFEVSADGSGEPKRLFPGGPNQPMGIVSQGDELLMADAIMVRSFRDGSFRQSKLNAWASHEMPLPMSLTRGPGERVVWTDCVNGALAMGDPDSGEVKMLAGGLSRPVSALMSPSGKRIFVAEYGSDRITAVSLADGSKSVLAKNLEGPLALAMMEGTLYVAEAGAGRISSVDARTGDKEVLVSSLVGKPGALTGDGQGNLLVLDGAGGRLLRIDPETLSVSMVAADLPVQYATVGSYPPVEFPLPMEVTDSGDIYLPTAKRGMLMLEKR